MEIIVDRPKLNLIIQSVARGTEKKAYRPRVSNAGACPRALVYQAIGVPVKSDTRMPVLLSDGSLHEDSTIDWLSRGNLNIMMRQFGLDVAEIPDEVHPDWYCEDCDRLINGKILHGHIDGVVDDGNKYYLFEHKGLGDYGFENLDRQFPKGYITQCCAYIKGLQNAGFDITSALLLIKNKNTSEYKQIYIEYDSDLDIARAENEWSGVCDIFPNILQELVDLHTTVAISRAPNANLPDRPFDQESKNCEWCAYTDTCWSGIRSEVAGRISNKVVSRASNLGRAISELADARKEKLQTAEKEKQAKKKIHSIMSQMDIRSGESEDYKFWLAPFDKKYIDESEIPVDVLEKARKSMTFMSIKLKEK